MEIYAISQPQAELIRKSNKIVELWFSVLKPDYGLLCARGVAHSSSVPFLFFPLCQGSSRVCVCCAFDVGSSV